MRRTAIAAVPGGIFLAWVLGVAGSAPTLPKFEPDPYWPKHLPNHWILGQVSGVAVDSRDNIWVIHRPRTTDEHDNYLRDKTADCCTPAPPVLEFDQAGNLIQSWGGPGQGYEWPDTEHGIFVDQKDNVWITGNGDKDTNLLKFSKAGKFLLQIGHHGTTGGSNDTANVNRRGGNRDVPAHERSVRRGRIRKPASDRVRCRYGSL